MEKVILNKLEMGNLLFQRIRPIVEARIKNEQLIHIQTANCFYNETKLRISIPEFDYESCINTCDGDNYSLIAYRFKNPKTGIDTLVYANEEDAEALAGY